LALFICRWQLRECAPEIRQRQLFLKSVSAGVQKEKVERVQKEKI
jgi:hypothetical protein